MNCLIHKTGANAFANRRTQTVEAQRALAKQRSEWIARRSFYYDLMRRALAFLVEPGGRVLNIRSQTGWMLDAVRPSEGVGMEITSEMNEVARCEHPKFQYVTGFPDVDRVEGVFDTILVADPGETADFQQELENLRANCHRATRLFIYAYNPMWEFLLKLAVRLGWKMPLPEQSWLDTFDFEGLLKLSGFELVKVHYLALLPIGVPLLSRFFNEVLAGIPLLRRLSMVRILVARPVPEAVEPSHHTVSVIIPCLNEEGNIAPAVERIPDLGAGTELIFCDDNSTDATRAEIERIIREHPQKNIRLVQGPGISKSRNVWAGFREAKGDILAILDADLAVMPEELPRFVEALARNHGEFINGSRLVYPVPQLAMKTTNMAGNIVFSWLFSLLLGQRIKDTLCGTKVLWRSDWERLEKYIDFWGVSDRWGDYDLLLGAAKLHLRIVDLPVHYQERMVGVSKMTRVLHNAAIMLSIMWHASRKMRRHEQ
jgi:hypothetical protein